MASTTRRRTKQVTASELPTLRIGQFRTRTSNTNSLAFKGPLLPWPNFIRDVDAAITSQRWSTRVIKHTERLDEEVVEIGDEYGVQGRFQQWIGSVMGHVFQAQAIDLHFADFKCLGHRYSGTPDTILQTSQTELKIVGELKVPWIRKHRLSGLAAQSLQFRHLLSDSINYMYDLDCMYGFLSTYDETIFLKQELVQGTWRIYYSPVIQGSARYVPANQNAGQLVVSVRQCFLHVAELAVREGPVTNKPLKSAWFGN
ncbi:hypothetical protein N7468_002693 [Penicillium chermesinum]|uniref:Uncharacterized protein n=1 Tax=Penicillium chermesinum TaxID=63820 RepID=A0A9W9PJ45_9EURO|nr:uncharacterized protein N7468_002693 [Penicillium chermesinum]KAJ5247710.1 hypothetical protein N7468_002693 [Penicillium chermesinum]KAJ6151475.1 hypothetical protein N7470_007072 [Penicillium chermesinum]